MSAIPKKKLTEAEYLAIEREAEFKSEFFDGEMFAMSGGKLAHNRIKENLARHIGNQLEDGPCFVVTSDMKVKVLKSGLYTYPDIVIICGSAEHPDPESTDILLNPAVIIEVLSPSTQDYDRGAKFRNYQKIKSLREYHLVAQDEPVVERFVRQANDDWLLTTTTGLDGELTFGTIPVRVGMAKIYVGVIFPDKPLRE